MNKLKVESSGCGCMIAFLIFNLALGGVSFDYCLWFIFGKNIPWLGDVICGFILAEITVPLMVICWLLKMFGVESPMIG